MKSVGLAGLEAGRLEVEVLDQQQAGRPDRLDGQRLALGDDQALLVAEPRGRPPRRPGTATSPAWVNSVAILVYWWRSPYRKRRAVGGGRLADLEAVAGAGRRGRRRPATPAIAARSGRRGSKNGSGWTTRMSADAAPQPRRPVERADDDRDDQHDEPGAEPRASGRS